jgi:hypothetical protein
VCLCVCVSLTAAVTTGVTYLTLTWCGWLRSGAHLPPVLSWSRCSDLLAVLCVGMDTVVIWNRNNRHEVTALSAEGHPPTALWWSEVHPQVTRCAVGPHNPRPCCGELLPSMLPCRAVQRRRCSLVAPPAASSSSTPALSPLHSSARPLPETSRAPLLSWVRVPGMAPWQSSLRTSRCVQQACRVLAAV